MKLANLGINSPTRLRDLIRNIRTARTAAEERSIAQKESALIRDHFRHEDSLWRSRSVAKLLYLYLLGYPAHFGQLECLRLIASKSFTDKRIGYLGATLLLDENQSTHLLITNSLKKDLKSDNAYVTGLALSAMASICSPQMCHECLHDILDLITSPNPYVRKKAIACAVRILEKIPKSGCQFMEYVKPMLTDKHHGTICNGAVLLQSIVDREPDLVRPQASEFMSIITRTLKSFMLSGYNPDYDVGGISDPFVQVVLLKLIRTIYQLSLDIDEGVYDILAQIAGSTDPSKNVSNAVLYETVLTMLSLVNADQGLTIFGINVLARFLLNSDKNVRYVALGTLLQVVRTRQSAVQKYQTTIAECISDADILIKKRAMQLTFAIIDSGNVKATTASMIEFMGDASDPEFKADCTSNLFTCIIKYSADTKWQIDVIVSILQKGGDLVPDGLVARMMSFIASSPDYQRHACRRLLEALIADACSAQPMAQVACWCLGEFADKILGFHPLGSSAVSDFLQGQAIPSDKIVEMLDSCLHGQHSNAITKAYALNALMKVSVKLDDTERRKIEQSLSAFLRCPDVELQTRACEYTVILDKHDNLRRSIFAKMPDFVYAFNKLDLQTRNNNCAQLEETSAKSVDDSQSLIELEQPLASKVSQLSEDWQIIIQKHGLVARVCTKPINEIHGGNRSEVKVQIFNNSTDDFESILLQAAVPKGLKLTVLHPDRNSIRCGDPTPLTQVLIVEGPGGQKSKVRIRLRFVIKTGNTSLTEQTEFSFD